MNKRSRGEFFELKAKEFLESEGFKSLGKNVYLSHGEIDLIMLEGEEIVFVEVKSLRHNSEFSIYEALTKSKLSKLKNSILTWININNFHNRIWRLDFVGIIYDNDSVVEVEHLRNIEIQ